MALVGDAAIDALKRGMRAQFVSDAYGYSRADLLKVMAQAGYAYNRETDVFILGAPLRDRSDPPVVPAGAPTRQQAWNDPRRAAHRLLNAGDGSARLRRLYDRVEADLEALAILVDRELAALAAGRRRIVRVPREVSDEPARIRAWAAQAGYVVAERGRLRKDLIAEYRALHPAEGAPHEHPMPDPPVQLVP